MRAWRNLIIGAVCGAGVMSAGSAMAETFMPVRAQGVRESIGINTHIRFIDGAYARTSDVIRALDYLGIDKVRDSAPDVRSGGQLPLAPYIWMNKAGIRFDLIVNGDPFDAKKAIAGIERLQAERPGAIESIEGFNEVNIWPATFRGVRSVEASVEAHMTLVGALNNHPALSHIPVLDLTGADDPADLAGRGDYHNFHVYAQNGDQPGKWIERAGVLKGRLWALTEFGYPSNPQSGWQVIGVDEATQARGLLNGILDAAKNGAWRIYLYELLDEKPDPKGADTQMHFGLLSYENKPKLSAIALRNFLRIIEDSGAPDAALQPLDMTLSGAPETLRTLVMQKASGRLQIALWNEAAFWDRAQGTPIENAAVPVTLSLPAGAKAVAFYDPLKQDTPIQNLHGEGQVQVSVPDYPVIVEIRR